MNKSKCNNVSVKSIIIGVVVAVLMTLTSKANAGEGWTYTRNFGLAHCIFAATASQGSTVNTTVSSEGSRLVKVTSESGLPVQLYLFCERKQEFNDQGDLVSIGASGKYKSSLGGGSSVGFDKPDEGNRPRGMLWSVPVEKGVAKSLTLSWTGEMGSDELSVSIEGKDPPVTKTEMTSAIDPVKKHADEAYDRSSGIDHEDYLNRGFRLTLNGALHLDSIGTSASTRKGWGVDLDVFLGGSGEFKLLTGVTFGEDFRQKAVVSAPGMPSNGYNSWVDWQTFYVGPKFGFDYMPAKFMSVSVYGSLGAFVSVDGTIPISQTADRTLYSGESHTDTVLGYKAMASLNFVVGNHFTFGPSLGLLGNIGKLPTARGPELVCNTGSGDCYKQRESRFVDVLGLLQAGLVF